jgi:hypothetical protein
MDTFYYSFYLDSNKEITWNYSGNKRLTDLKNCFVKHITTHKVSPYQNNQRLKGTRILDEFFIH